MKKCITLLAVMFLVGIQAKAQYITVQDAVGQSPLSFIQNNFLGEGVYVFNAKFQNVGSVITMPQIGTFQANGFEGLSMDSGIVMTTGNISVAPGPNNSGSASSALSSFYTDPQMASVASADCKGCATLDFDFVALSNTVSFTYCFGSEEYPEYVASQFNDVFAFFITGTDPITGDEVTRNMAMIPGSEDAAHPHGIAVAINSVNPGVAGSYGSSTEPSFTGAYAQYYTANVEGSDAAIQYDGYTVKLMAQADIVPCEVYHMHISICNVGDNSYDSGVFIEGNTFSSSAAVVDLGQGGTDTISSICPRDVNFNLSETYYTWGKVHATFGGDAVNGVDFSCVSDSGAVINEGHDFFYISDEDHHITINALPTADFSTPKHLDIYLETELCQSIPDFTTHDTLHYVFVNGEAIQLRDTIFECEGGCYNVGVELVAGMTPATFEWFPKTGIGHPYQQNTSCVIHETSDYIVVATDRMGCTTDTAHVHVEITQRQDPPTPEGIDGVNASNIKVYPNPADEELTIEAANIQKVEIFAADGKRVFAEDCNTNKIQVNVTKFAAGAYTLRVVSQEGSSLTKIIVR